MLYFKEIKSVTQQKNYLKKEIYYKLYKLFVIFLKWNNLLARLILQFKKSIYYKNICIVSKKNKSVSRILKVSRVILREKSNIGFFYGISKLTW